MNPEDGQQDDQKDGEPLLWGKAKTIRIVQPEKRQLQSDLIVTFQYQKGAYMKEEIS